MDNKKTLAGPTLGERIGVCVDKIGGRRAAGDVFQISEAQLYRYMSGERCPPTDFILQLAETAKVSPAWLLTGEGAQERSETKPRPPFRPDLLTHLTKLLDECLQEQNYKLTPLQRAKALTFLYEAAALEEATTGRQAFLSTGEILGALDYICAGSPIEDSIDLHLQAMRLLEGWENIPENFSLPFFFQRWTKLAIEGQKRYMDMSQGEIIYTMFGYEIVEKGAARLRNMVNSVINKTSTKELAFLDIGCGNGREIAFIAQNYPFIKVKGIDVSERAINLAKVLESNGKIPKNSLVLGDATELPFAAKTFDFVYSRLALAFVPSIEGNVNLGAGKLLQEISRVLKPGGTAEIFLPTGAGRDYLPLRQNYTKEIIEHFLEHIPNLELESWKNLPVVTEITYRFESKFTQRAVLTLRKKTETT